MKKNLEMSKGYEKEWHKSRKNTKEGVLKRE